MTQDATQLGIRLPQAPQTKRGLSIHVVRSARWFPAVPVSVLVRVEDYMEARSRDDDVLHWAHVHGYCPSSPAGASQIAVIQMTMSVNDS